MKSNKEKVYDFIRLHADEKADRGISTAYIADAMELQRTNVSSILNLLVQEGRIQKCNGRPVLYKVGREESTLEECFSDLIGADGSLRQTIQLAKAAVLYPQRSLNTLLVGARGTGKSRLAQRMYRFAVEQKILPENAPFLHIDCHDYAAGGEVSAESDDSWKQSEQGFVFFDNIQFLSPRARKRVLEYLQSPSRKYAVAVSCTDKEQLSDEFLAEFSVQLQLPTLSERPLRERMEMIKHLFSKEAVRIQRPLVVRGDLMTCLLFYECEANYYQLKGDIKIGCANAYVREYGKTGDISLFISDFSNNVRKGMLKYRREAEELIDFEQKFTFSGKEIRVSRPEDGTLYDRISRKAAALKETGIEEEEINLLLSMEVERTFDKYRKALIQDVTDKKQLEILVEEKLINIVEAFLQKAKEQLKRNFSPSVLYGLCLHLNAVITGKREKSAPDKESIAEILVYHRAEYLLSEELAEQIKAEYAVELSMEEILLLTMFLCYQNEEKTENARPVLIFAFYGVGIASSIAQTVSNMTKLDNIFSYEITSERASAEVYGTLRNFLKKVQQGKGILVIYDSSFLGEMLLEIENELEIPIRQVRVPVTTLGIELARRTLTENDPDKILQSTVESIDGLDCYRKYIVTLCTTGKGGAEELKRYIEKYGQLEDTEVIPISVTEKELLRDNLKHLMTTGVVQCIVGTYDPGMFAIPFLPISEVFGARKESLPRLLRLEKEAKAKIDYDAMFAYLGEQLTHTDIEKLRKILPDIMKEINSAFMELSLDAEAGLLIHISCCIDRLLAKQEVATNPRKAAILLQYDKEFKKLLKIVKPLEKTFHVIINDDEIANILTIIYQL